MGDPSTPDVRLASERTPAMPGKGSAQNLSTSPSPQPGRADGPPQTCRERPRQAQQRVHGDRSACAQPQP